MGWCGSGGEEFNRRFRKRGPVVRLKMMMEWGPCVTLDDTDELVGTLRSLVDKRNPIVHMQSNEEVFDAAGRILRPAQRPLDELEGAEAAVNEMEQVLCAFADLIAKHDIESWAYVAPMWKALL